MCVCVCVCVCVCWVCVYAACAWEGDSTKSLDYELPDDRSRDEYACVCGCSGGSQVVRIDQKP